MLKTLIGDKAFFDGMAIYFERHDGEAATVEQFLAAMAEASGRDLSQFFIWYTQSGTPELAVSGTYRAATRRYELHIAQTCPPTADDGDKKPLHIPLRLGLIGADGEDIPLSLKNGATLNGDVIELSEPEHHFVFENVPARPVLSLNRGFSAPVRISADRHENDLLRQMASDSDPFNRWEAGQVYGARLLKSLVAAVRSGEPLRTGAGLGDALRACLDDRTLEPAFVAQMLQLPGEADLALEIGTDVDPGAIHVAREHLRMTIGQALHDEMVALHDHFSSSGPYAPDAASAGERSLRAMALSYLVAADPVKGAKRAFAQYSSAGNMTDIMAALSVLATAECPERTTALADFYERWKDDHLVVDKWLALQAGAPFAHTPDAVRQLMRHDSFSLSNPNKVRALVGTFAAANPVAFNAPGGEGYGLVADVVLALDPVNPQVAARLSGAFRNWRILEPTRRANAETAMQRIAAAADLSRDTTEIISKMLQ